MAGTKSKNRKKRKPDNLVAQPNALLDKPNTGKHADHDNRSAQPLSWLQRIFVGLIRFYQLTISRALPSSCRFTPSCSEYTRQAVVKYGAVWGSWLGAKRIARCHPFHPGGYDPVP